MQNTTQLIEALEAEGYSHIREVPGQGFCGILEMMFTIGVFCGLTSDSYEFRYCFPKEYPGAAEKALAEWDGQGHIGGPWIKCKGRGWGDVVNPEYEKIFNKHEHI